MLLSLTHVISDRGRASRKLRKINWNCVKTSPECETQVAVMSFWDYYKSASHSQGFFWAEHPAQIFESYLCFFYSVPIRVLDGWSFWEGGYQLFCDPQWPMATHSSLLHVDSQGLAMQLSLWSLILNDNTARHTAERLSFCSIYDQLITWRKQKSSLQDVLMTFWSVKKQTMIRCCEEKRFLSG